MDRVLPDYQPGLATSAIVGTLTITKTGTTARTVTFPDAAITVARTDAAQTFTGQSTFTDGILTTHCDASSSAGVHIGNNAHADVAIFGAAGGTGTTLYGQLNSAAISATSSDGVQTQQASTQDAVAIKGRSGGTGSYVATLTPPALSASITLTLPAVSGTLAVLGANTFTGAQVFQDQITTEAIFRDVLSVATAAGTTTGDATDHVVVFTGTTTQTYTLPAAAAGREIIVKNRSTGNVTINRAGSDTIDGGTSIVLTANQWVKLVANSADWCIVG